MTLQKNQNVIEMVVKKTVEEYNKYRAPEAIANILNIENDRVVVIFRGSFCETCGVYDWVEDLKYELENFNVNADIISIKEEKNQRIAVFRLKY
jgi:hypothetical protein